MSARNDSLRALLGPTDPQVSCEECFERLDEYVERELEDADAETRVPGMRAHLDGCPACREEHESLRALASR
jgi:anti-sigma factor RsiW